MTPRVDRNRIVALVICQGFTSCEYLRKSDLLGQAVVGRLGGVAQQPTIAEAEAERPPSVA